MPINTTTTIVCDCCDRSFSPNDEQYLSLQVPTVGQVGYFTTKVFCVANDCADEVSAGLLDRLTTVKTNHVTSGMSALHPVSGLIP